MTKSTARHALYGREIANCVSSFGQCGEWERQGTTEDQYRSLYQTNRLRKSDFGASGRFL